MAAAAGNNGGGHVIRGFLFLFPSLLFGWPVKPPGTASTQQDKLYSKVDVNALSSSFSLLKGEL